MALVPCPECQKEVSTEARTCPQCAFPFPGKKEGRENPSAPSLPTCPECNGPVSAHARGCPHCGVSLTGGRRSQGRSGDLFQETLLCPHCGLSYTRTIAEGAGLPGTMSSVKRVEAGDTVEIQGGQSDFPLKDPALLGSRRPSPLWQDPSIGQKLAQKLTSPRRPHRSKRHSLIIGLLLLVIIAISVLFGAIWQLKGLTPVEVLLSWSM